jgi:hypothetical protein
MNHFDEHIIELYVLRSETVEDRRGEIERHLGECHGCQSLAQEIERFYAEFEKALQETKTAEPVLATALARAPRSIEPYYEPYSPVEPYRPATVVGRVRHFIRRYPIATGVGSFALAAALMAVVLFRNSKGPLDSNPSYPHINPQNGTLEVLDKENQKLWEIPSAALHGASTEQMNTAYGKIIITDLEGDGANEVVTGLELGSQMTGIMPLSIYGSDNRPRFEHYFKNDDKQCVGELRVVGYSGRPEKDIFVQANMGRSPHSIYRLSHAGEVIGEYNHFGAGYIRETLFPGTDHPRLVFFGQNDVDESDSLSYGVLIVLDPARMTGRTEASDSRGFGLPLSDAEEYVIRFPLTDMHYVFNSPGRIENVITTTSGGKFIIEVRVEGNHSDESVRMGAGPAYFCYFDAGMNIDYLKFDSVTMRLRQNLVDQGKLKPKSIEDFLGELKDGIRYWNGTAWQKEATTVKHKPEA